MSGYSFSRANPVGCFVVSHQVALDLVRDFDFFKQNYMLSPVQIQSLSVEQLQLLCQNAQRDCLSLASVLHFISNELHSLYSLYPFFIESSLHQAVDKQEEGKRKQANDASRFGILEKHLVEPKDRCYYKNAVDPNLSSPQNVPFEDMRTTHETRPEELCAESESLSTNRNKPDSPTLGNTACMQEATPVGVHPSPPSQPNFFPSPKRLVFPYVPEETTPSQQQSGMDVSGSRTGQSAKPTMEALLDSIQQLNPDERLLLLEKTFQSFKL